MTPEPDSLAATMPADAQRQAARVAQDAFAAVFRLTVDGDLAGHDAALAEVGQRCRDWCAAGAGEEARTLRRVLLAAGLDQWGLAYTQAFDLAAIPALTALLGALRTALDANEEIVRNSTPRQMTNALETMSRALKVQDELGQQVAADLMDHPEFQQ